MSRSYRNTPIRSNGGTSEKQDKRDYNRCLRTHVRQILRDTSLDFDAVVLPEVRDVSNPWSMNKDGKHYGDRLARFIATLDKVTRVRDGRRRTQFVITDATVELAAVTNRCFMLRFYWLRNVNDTFSTVEEARQDASHHIDDFRK